MTPSDRFDHITRHGLPKRPVREIGNLPDQDQPDGPHLVVLIDPRSWAAIVQAKLHPERAKTMELISADHH